MKKRKTLILNGTVIIALMLLTSYFIYKNVTYQSVVQKDNITLFLATDGSVLRSQELEEDKIKKIAIYFPETKQNNYLQHDRYQIFLDDNAFMQTMYERATKAGDIFAAYVFQPRMKYSSNFMFAVKQEYVFNPGRDNEIQYAIEYRPNTREKQVLHYYEYYPNTKFNKQPEDHIKAVYYVNQAGELEYSMELEEGTGRELTKHYYEEKTVYDQENFSHKAKIVRSEVVSLT